MRSSINFFTLNTLDLDENMFVQRLFKYFYKNRPLRPRYNTFWPVSKLLDVLKTWFPIETLDLRSLTLKVIALIALTSSDRGQTLHLISVKDMVISNDKIEFVIKKPTKTTRRILKPIVVTCVSSPTQEELDVANHVKVYLEKTKPYRTSHDNFFISWKTFKPVTKQSLARWLTLVLKIAKIDTSIFTAHSFRGAGLSKALSKGAPISQIVSSGNWSNVSTFLNYYNAPSYDSEIGNIILND